MQKIAKVRTAIDSVDVPPSLRTEAVQTDCSLCNFTAVTEASLRRIIMKSPTKSCSSDPIPTWLLKEPGVLDAVLPFLVTAINESLTTGVVPACLKQASIIPLLKKKGLDVECLANYRPVSILPFISKILEKVVAAQLTAHLTENNLLDPLQSAYRAGHSTESALTKIKSDIDQALDRGQGALLVLLDLSAAFDTLDHGILLNRLNRRCGISGNVLNWFRSYLADRVQAVQIGDEHSALTDVSIGVPQGSVLGPLLFSVYVSPLGDILNESALDHHGYADDTQLYTFFSPQTEGSLALAISHLEPCITEVQSWMLRNKLKLNTGKTEFMVIVAPHHRQAVTRLEPTLRVGTDDIVPAKVVRNLGASFDSAMTMQPFVNQLTRSCYYQLRCLKRIRCFLDHNACTAAVQALIVSRLDYCNSLLAGLPECHLRKLQLVQNSAARLLTRTSRRAHITPILRELHWLPVRQRITHKVMCLTYKAIHEDTAPVYLRDMLQERQTRSLRSSAAALQLVVPRTRRAYGDRSFMAYAPTMWNRLPPAVRNSPSMVSFKKSLKTFLFIQTYGNN